MAARILPSAGLLLSLLIASAAPVLADCAQPLPVKEAIAKADTAFVGTVTGLSNNGRWATVAVAEVWAGPDLAPIVEVRGGPPGNSASSVDRTFTGGTRYLFLAYITDGVLNDNSCSSTTEWEPGLANLRPAGARPPISAVDPQAGVPFDPATLLVPAALVVGAGFLVFGAALVLRRRT